MTARDRKAFPGYFEASAAPFPREPFPVGVCVDALRYVGHDAVRADIANFRTALDGVAVEEAFLPAVTPGTIEHWMRNEHYGTDEEFIFAIAEVMREEYEAIVDGGFLLQIDDPDLPNGWACLPDVGVPNTANAQRCGSRRSITPCATFRGRRCGCMSAGAASTGRSRTTYRSPTSPT